MSAADVPRFEDAADVASVPAGTVQRVDVEVGSTIVWGGARSEDSHLSRLWRRAAAPQWQVHDLDWSRDVEPADRFRVQRDLSRVHPRSPFGKFSERDWAEFDERCLRYFISQVLYGEQLSIVATSQLSSSAPSWDAKLFAAAQAADEARHVVAFERYAAELGELYPMNGQLSALFSDAVGSARWELLYVAVQILIEGMGLGTFDLLAANTADPLLGRMLQLVSADEARHVAFGVTELRGVLAGSTSAEARELAEFAFESAQLLRTRMVAVPVLEEMGVDARSFLRTARRSPEFRRADATVFGPLMTLVRRSGLGDVEGAQLLERFADAGFPVTARR